MQGKIYSITYGTMVEETRGAIDENHGVSRANVLSVVNHAEMVDNERQHGQAEATETEKGELAEAAANDVIEQAAIETEASRSGNHEGRTGGSSESSRGGNKKAG
jgi:hypothetical protein